MGIVYSYLYTRPAVEEAHEDREEDKEKEKEEGEGGNPNYTILYSEREKEYLQQLQETAKKQADAFSRQHVEKLPQDWNNMSPRYEPRS